VAPRHAASPEPGAQTLALAHIKQFEIVASAHDGLDAVAGYAYTASHGEVAQLDEVEGDGSQRGVGDGGAAEGQREGGQRWTRDCKDLGRCISECAAEAL
jgi:hypothetical protein